MDSSWSRAPQLEQAGDLIYAVVAPPFRYHFQNKMPHPPRAQRVDARSQHGQLGALGVDMPKVDLAHACQRVHLHAIFFINKRE